MITITQGDTVFLELTVRDDQGNIIDLADYDVWWTLKDDLSKTDAQATLQKTKASGISIQDSLAVVTLTDIDTAGLDTSVSYFFDVQVKSRSGDISTPISDKLKAKPQVTKSTI